MRETKSNFRMLIDIMLQTALLILAIGEKFYIAATVIAYRWGRTIIKYIKERDFDV